jgi:hypothetical protein
MIPLIRLAGIDTPTEFRFHPVHVIGAELPGFSPMEGPFMRWRIERHVTAGWK